MNTEIEVNDDDVFSGGGYTIETDVGPPTKSTSGIDRSSRSSTSREKTGRRKPWKPPSSLDAPPAPEGFIHRWIRFSVMGKDDTKNLSGRLREGFDLVRADEYPDFEIPSLDEGKHAGVISIGGLLLARFPKESKAERDGYYNGVTRDQIAATDNDLLKDQHSSMGIFKPDRQSRVSFGSSGS